MAERAEEPESEGAGEAGAAPISPAAAMAIGARRHRAGAVPDPKLDAFLDRQILFTDLQTEHLHEQRELLLSRLRWGRFSDRLKVGLQLMTMAVGLAVALAIAVMAWQAGQDHGVSIEAFSVPPDLAQRGLTGQVVAIKVLDSLASMQAKTVTARPASTYVNDWGGDIKVEIPETGVSIGELNRWLRERLGHETRITGEVVRTASGVAVTARAGDAKARDFEGVDADFNKLIQQAAEAVYAQTQPYRYAVYLASVGRSDEAMTKFAWLARSGLPEDRAWAYAGWGSILNQKLRMRDAARMAEAALRLNPRLEPAYPVLGTSLDALRRQEAVLASVRSELALMKSGRAIGLPKEAMPSRIQLCSTSRATCSATTVAPQQ